MALALARRLRFALPAAVLCLIACEDAGTTTTSPLPAACAGPGTICAVAGNGDPAFIGEGEPALGTSLYWPVDLEFAPDGRAYILDWQNHRVRRIDGDGRLRTVFGTDEIGDGPIPGTGDETAAPGVPATSINLNHPTDLQFSPDGRSEERRVGKEGRCAMRRYQKETEVE